MKWDWNNCLELDPDIPLRKTEIACCSRKSGFEVRHLRTALTKLCGVAYISSSVWICFLVFKEWIRYLLLHSKLPCNLAFNNSYVLFHTVPESQESGNSLAGWFWFQVSLVAGKVSAGPIFTWKLGRLGDLPPSSCPGLLTGGFSSSPCGVSIGLLWTW